MNLLNFHYGILLLKQLYDIEISEIDYEELGLIAFNKIGNRRTFTITKEFNVGNNNLINLPCEATRVKAVYTTIQDYRTSSNKGDEDIVSSFSTEQYVGSLQEYNPSMAKGKLLSYSIVGNQLKLHSYLPSVYIIYSVAVVDKDNLPMITEKEALAIAAYIAYRMQFKKGLVTQNGNSVQLAQLLQQEWERACAQARIIFRDKGDYISDNELNEIMDTMISWERKSYGKTAKFIGG